MEITNLETFFNRRKAEYADHPAWQWQDEGIPFALMEYLSHCGEFTEADREFIKANNLEYEADYAQHDHDTAQTDYKPVDDTPTGKMDELLANIRGAIGSYYADEEKYGEGYAVKDLLAFLERISNYQNPAE